jgi:hypothetical protein
MSHIGHKTEAVFRRYAIVDSAVQAEAAALLNAHEAQQPPRWALRVAR